MPELTPRREPSPIPAPTETEVRTANELLENIEKLAPESFNVAQAGESLSELAQGLKQRANEE